MNTAFVRFVVVVFACLSLGPKCVFAQGTAFTYQGRLNDGANPASGIYDLRFALYDALAAGTQHGSAITIVATGVSNGLFTVTLDFGNQYSGEDIWLEISVRTNGAGAFTTLAPRQALTSVPYAVRAANVNAAGLSGTIPSSALEGTYSGALTLDNAANSISGTFYGNYYGLNFIGGSFAGAFIGNGSGLGSLNGSQILSGTVPAAALANSWRTIGNGGTTPATHFIGTTDNQPFELRANNRRVLRLEPNANYSPNIVAGSASNSITGVGIEGATIAGGGIGLYPNRITASYATIGGGTFHKIDGPWSTIAGGRDNVILSDHSAIGGGYANQTGPLSSVATIGGGYNNIISTNADYCVIGGGYQNNVNQNLIVATLGGGAFNFAGSNCNYTTISGGHHNGTVMDANYASIGGGSGNRITNEAHYATIPGGFQNLAAANSFAAGTRAKALHQGAFVWADSQITDFPSLTNNEVAFRASGGVRFTTALGGGINTVSWTPGSASWSFTSDRNTKENLSSVDTSAVLEKVAALPLHEWNYIGYGQRHIGPMAQDFHAAFPLNDSDTTLNTADLQGVTLAAIQGLNQKLTEELRRREAENAELKQRLEKLEQLMNQKLNGGDQ